MPTRRSSPARRPPPAKQRFPPATPSPPLRGAEVVLDLEVEHGRVHLILANCGEAVATEVVVEFSRSLAGVDSIDVSGLPVFTRLGVLRPGRVLRIFWDAASALFERGEGDRPFVATVAWSERGRRRQRVAYHHDLAIYRHLPECV
jgi:hypothetical protein